MQDRTLEMIVAELERQNGVMAAEIARINATLVAHGYRSPEPKLEADGETLDPNGGTNENPLGK